MTSSHARTFSFVFVHGMGFLNHTDRESNRHGPVFFLNIWKLSFSPSELIMLSSIANANTGQWPKLSIAVANMSLHVDPSTLYETSPFSEFLRVDVVMLMVACVPSWRWHGNGRLPLWRWKQAPLLFPIFLCVQCWNGAVEEGNVHLFNTTITGN